MGHVTCLRGILNSLMKPWKVMVTAPESVGGRKESTACSGATVKQRTETVPFGLSLGQTRGGSSFSSWSKYRMDATATYQGPCEYVCVGESSWPRLRSRLASPWHRVLLHRAVPF